MSSLNCLMKTRNCSPEYNCGSRCWLGGRWVCRSLFAQENAKFITEDGRDGEEARFPVASEQQVLQGWFRAEDDQAGSQFDLRCVAHG